MTRLDDNDWTDLDDIDVWTVDRLLDGTLPATEVPLGYEEVASLLSVVKQGVAPAESGWGSRTVPAMARILSSPPPSRRRRVRPSFVAAHAGRATHAAAAVLVFAALGAGAAAAADGALPAPVQSAVHSAAADLGVAALAPGPSSGAVDRRSVVRPSPLSGQEAARPRIPSMETTAPTSPHPSVAGQAGVGQGAGSTAGGRATSSPSGQDTVGNGAASSTNPAPSAVAPFTAPTTADTTPATPPSTTFANPVPSAGKGQGGSPANPGGVANVQGHGHS